MMFLSLVVLATAGLSALAQNSTTSNQTIASVEQAFNTSQIVPNIIITFQPTALLDVVFGNTTVTPGLNLTTDQTLNAPQFFLSANSTTGLESDTFVIALVDPDAPTPQNTSLAQFRHFLGGGFKLNTTSGTNGTNSTGIPLTNSSAALTEFVNPTPPAGSDPHRYIALLFRQPDNFTTAAAGLVNSSTPRNNFNITTFASSVGLGSPVAGNFFFTGPASNSSNATSSGGAPSPSSGSSNGAIHTLGLDGSVFSLVTVISLLLPLI